MNSFIEGQRVKAINVYGPADTDFSDKYYDMEVTMEKGVYNDIPWVRAIHRTTNRTTMVNCNQCACITLSEEPPEHIEWNF